MTIGYTSGYDFENKILSGVKVHTIRKDENDRWKAGSSIQHVTGNRTKQRNEFYSGVCSGTQRIVITFNAAGKIDIVTVDGKETPVWEIIAVNDGLSVNEFEGWFYKSSTGGVFKGKIIHWTNIRY